MKGSNPTLLITITHMMVYYIFIEGLWGYQEFVSHHSIYISNVSISAKSCLGLTINTVHDLLTDLKVQEERQTLAMRRMVLRTGYYSAIADVI